MAPFRVNPPTMHNMDCPWDAPNFATPPRLSKDSWLEELWEDGWLVREHGSRRSRPFQPLISSLPHSADQLTGKRVTVMIYSNGTKEVREDLWTDPPKKKDWPSDVKWIGYTFFERKRVEEPWPGAASSSTTGDQMPLTRAPRTIRGYYTQRTQRDEDDWEAM